MIKTQDERIINAIIEETIQASYEEESLQDYFECMNDYKEGTMNI